MTALGSRNSGMCSFFAMLRNSKVEHCAGCVLAYGPEPASMGLKNRPANGESHAHAPRLRCIERVKDLVYCVGSDTCPRVFNCSLHALCINILGLDD